MSVSLKYGSDLDVSARRRRRNVSWNLPNAVDTMWTQPAQIQTDPPDQNRTRRDSITARTPLIFRSGTAQPA